MSPYRNALVVTRPYRHDWRMRLRRWLQRLFVRTAPKLVRKQCWACGRGHGVERGGSSFVQCGWSYEAHCLRCISECTAEHFQYWPADDSGSLIPRHGGRRGKREL